jgi:RimJ/RimL family protein N-acetyltransferase
MSQIIELETERLKLRQWKESDYPSFAKMNADAEVMKYYPSLMNQTESDEMAHNIQGFISERGWGFWAVEEKINKHFIGFVGLHERIEALPFCPCVEIGWRLATEYWGKGYATEAAKAALHFAFGSLALSEVYSFTSLHNLRSRAVMERLNMVNTHQNFEHPKVPVGNPLREHVLYRLTREQWYDFLGEPAKLS